MASREEEEELTSSLVGVKRVRDAQPKPKHTQDWKGKALDLQEKVMTLESVLERMTPMVRDLCRQDTADREASALEDTLLGRAGDLDKNKVVESLLEVLLPPSRPLTVPTPEPREKEEDDDDEEESRLRAFEEALWVLPSFWNTSTISELSFVHLEALASDIARRLLARRDLDPTLADHDPRTGRITSLVRHLVGIICSRDPFEKEPDEKDDVQQIHNVKESCVTILAKALGSHPPINLCIIRTVAKHLLEKVTTALWDDPTPPHVFLEDFYWILHLLEVTLERKCLRECDTLTPSMWQAVKDVTDTIVEVERVLLQLDNPLSNSILFMNQWDTVLRELSVSSWSSATWNTEPPYRGNQRGPPVTPVTMATSPTRTSAPSLDARSLHSKGSVPSFRRNKASWRTKSGSWRS